ncbi:MAG: 2-oxo acid dehydrogenase subunit E2 [Candidatus Krumholzibacteria bacterium]|nr:2-oxo acid dehydrogenase subunit E2 [Candidatus Krumholzibacteria bacterium]
MATKIHMEALSPTMEEGRLVKWLKAEGAAVSTGETLAEVETDKAVMELVARADGHLIKIVVPEGKTVAVGAVVGYIGTPGETVAAGAAGAAVADAAAGTSAVPAGPAPGVRLTAPALAPADATRVRASPLARRLARDRGVDIRTVLGSGPGGRVVKQDVEATEGGRQPAARSAAAAGPRAAAAPPTAAERGAAYEDVPLTQIRKTIAKRLAASTGPVPHFYLTAELDMERAAEAREALNRDLGDRGKVSFNDIIVRATAAALVRHRACNAWFQDDHIRYWNDVHIGMAVAVEEGLITPVVRHANHKSLLEIGEESRALARRARERRLTPEEYTGATFSVSNLGMFEIDQFTAVINPPEAGILAIGAVAPRPVAVDGEVRVRRRMRVTMSCDHRVIDGATGAAFLQTLRQMLENPLAMLL